MLVQVLLVQNLVEKLFDTSPEVTEDAAVLRRMQQVFEFVEHVFVLARVELGAVRVKVLNRCQHRLEVEAGRRNLADANRENRLQRLIALGVLAHGAVMQGVSVVDVLEGEYLTVALDHILGVRLKKVGDADDEIFKPVDQISILVERAVQSAVLDVHVLEA